jgi:hypothetical protein
MEDIDCVLLKQDFADQTQRHSIWSSFLRAHRASQALDGKSQITPGRRKNGVLLFSFPGIEFRQPTFLYVSTMFILFNDIEWPVSDWQFNSGQFSPAEQMVAGWEPGAREAAEAAQPPNYGLPAGYASFVCDQLRYKSLRSLS